MEFSTLNGYKVKDKKAIRSYDTVALMKADTTLKEGQHVKTKGYYTSGDGGHGEYIIKSTSSSYYEELTNELVAELLSDKNNILCYGVTLSDSNSNNNTIIKDIIDELGYCYCNKEIVLNNGLVIDKADSKFEFNKITYTGTDNAITLNNNHITLTGNSLLSNGNGLHVGGDNVTMFCNIKINKIEVEKTGIEIGGSTGTYYNTFDITRIMYKIHGVNILLDNYYVGENEFYNTCFDDKSDNSITDQYAFNCIATNYRATGFKFYNISFEGAKGGFYFEGTGKLCEYLQVFGLRCTELSFNNHKVLKVKCNQTTIPLYGDIFFDNAKPSAFDFSEYTVASNDALILHGAFRNDFITSNGLLAYEGHPSYTRLVMTKLPRGYESLRTGDDIQLVKCKNIVGLYNTDKDTIKLKFGDSSYVYNGKVKMYVDNANVSKIEIYGTNESLVRTITINNRPCIIDFSIEQLFQSNQTQVLYSISNDGATSLFN